MIKTEAYNDSQQFLGLTRKNGVKAGKLYVQKPLNVASAFNVDRNLAAYRLNQEGLLELMGVDVPRIDYTNTCPELLVENEATNLVLQSETFDNASWNKLNCTITANAINAPNGQLTADKIIPSTSGVDRVIEQVFTVVANQDYVSTIYVKKGEYRWVYMYGLAFQLAWFDLDNGVVGSTSGTIQSSITSIGDYYRLQIITKTNITTGYFYFGSSDSNGSTSVTANGTDGTYIWGAQCEVTYSNRATSYIPTTTLAVTRPQDNVRNDNFGYTSNQGTIFVRARLTFSESVQGIVTLSDNGVFDDYITLYYVENVGVKYITAQTYTNPDQNEFLYIAPNNGVYNMAFAYDVVTGAYSFAVNGTIVDSGIAPLAMPLGASLTRMTLGEITTLCDSRTIGYMYFDSKLDNTSLENLTAI